MNDVSRNHGVTRGIGFTGALTITFIILKLTHVVAWSWLWVLAPIWISALITIVTIVAILGVAVVLVRRSRHR